MISNLYHLVSNAAKKWPNNIALIEAENGQSITYAKLDEKVKALSSQIIHKGLNRAERVGLLSRNSISYILAFFAISRAGGVIVPLNHELSASDLIRQSKDCAISALYASEPFIKKAKEICAKTKSIRFFIKGIEESPQCRKCKKVPKSKEKDPALIVYTSGTTRQPLGVMLSHRNIISNNKSIVKYTGISNAHKICCVLPFYYIYGLSLLCSHFLVGGTVILDNRFMYPSAVLDTIDRYKATGFAGVSSHYAILLYKSNIKRRTLPSLKYFMQAGDAMSPNITKELNEAFPDKKLYIMYGQTEASPRLTYLNPDLIKQKSNSIGKAIPGVEIKVVDIKGRECRSKDKGEIIARGNNIMLGYWNKDKETAKVIKKGWLYTGDIAFKDKDGDLFIVGRKKDFIKVGGNRVNLVEIENLAMRHEEVVEAAVIGIPDKILGEKIKLFIALTPDTKIRDDEILRFCKNKLPSYKMPVEIVILETMPKNSYGKTDKIKLRQI